MKKHHTSPFEPRSFTNFRPKYFDILTFNAGFKKKKKDLLIIDFKSKVPVAAVYSKTSTPSCPIIWDKKHNKGFCKVLVVNSGNANAHTGKKGIEAINKYTKKICKKFNCNQKQILVSSTGIIGEQIGSSKIINVLKKLPHKSQSLLDAAKAIMTTDTYPKVVLKKIKYKSKTIKIYGFAKGSGMIAPNMGTMLAYVFIEANLKTKELKYLLNKNVESTFNSITVDGDTSTSDTVMIFSISNNQKFNLTKELYDKLSIGVNEIMGQLAKKIVCDGEGISKLIEIKVLKALNLKQAKEISFSIANSILVKTAIAGEDANWGRIVMAIGKASKVINQNKITIKFGKYILAKNGSVNSKIEYNKIKSYMKNKLIQITVNLNSGTYGKVVWSSDLTHDYINLNSDYRT